MGDPCEISTVRREDFAFIRTAYSTEDVLQSNNAPSSGTSRGHQYPAAFLTVASGLDKHGLAAERPLSYTHLDIAGRCVCICFNRDPVVLRGMFDETTCDGDDRSHLAKPG